MLPILSILILSVILILIMVLPWICPAAHSEGNNKAAATLENGRWVCEGVVDTDRYGSSSGRIL